MAAYTVTENTSVVLISTLSTTPKIVYLSSISYPGHIVTIKDISGVVNQGSPVVVSTTSSIYFVDGSISTLLLDPYSFVTVASKTLNTWQILNNFGFLTTLSNAYIQQLTGSAAFVKTLSTVKDYVSTSFANTVTVTKDLQLLGDVAILGNITVGGIVDLFSTLSVKENIVFSTNFTVNGSVTFASTLFIRDEFTVGNVSTLQSLSVRDSLSVNTILDVSSINFKPNSNVQNVSMSSIFVSTNFQTAQGISSLNRTIVSNSVSTLSSFISLSSIFINETTRIDGYLDVAKNFQTNSMQSFSSGVVQGEASISSLSLRGILSTADSLFVKGSLLAKQQTNVNDVLVNGDVITSSLIVTGNVFISSIFLTGEMKIGQDSLLFSSLHTSTLLTGPFFALGNISVRGHTSVSSFFSTLTDMNIGGVLTVKGDLKAKEESGVVGSISNILTYIQPENFSTGNLYVSTNLAIADDFSIPGTAKADILGAPIRIELSTLTLSNAMNVTREASIPILQSSSNYEGFFPNTILAGENIQENTNRSPFFLNVNEAANIRNLLQFKSPSFAGEISSIRASTITSTNTLKTFLIGSSEYLAQTLPADGYLVLLNSGSTKSPFDISANNTPLFGTNLNFSSEPNASFYNSNQSLWVAVGRDSATLNTIQTSSNLGTTWNPILTGGFSQYGNDVVYMAKTFQQLTPPLWVATGNQESGLGLALQYSFDGSNWSNGSGTLFYSGEGNRLLYYPSPINSNDGAVIFAGGNGGGPVFGVLYSYDGMTWSNSLVQSGDASLVCKDIAAHPNRLIAVGYDSNNVNQMFVADGSNWAGPGWSNPYYGSNSNILYYPKPAMATFNTIAYGSNTSFGQRFILGGDASGGNPLTSMKYTDYNTGGSSNMDWQPIQTGGFTVRVNRIIFDSNQKLFFALGETTGGSNIQYSYNGINWYGLSNSITSPARNINQGRLEIPDSGGQYFIANVETRFETAISSASMSVSSIRASSIQSEYFVGDASQLTNANSFTNKLGVSSLSAKILDVGETLTFLGSTTANSFTVGNRGILYQTDFLSTINTWVATGISFEQNTMTQYTQNIRDWNPTSNTTFEFFGSALVGNSNRFNPFFVATGGDSRAEHTIQYSVNGYDWSNVQSGGFEDADESGVKKGNTVSYLTYLSTTQIRNRWLVGGRQNTIASTIFYSDDGSNFFAVPDLQFITDSNLGSNSIQKIKSAALQAVALTDIGKFIHTRDGYIWEAGQYLSGSVPPFEAFGYGYFSNPPYSPPGNYWAAIDTNTYLWYLLPGYTGFNWQPTASLTGLFGLIDMAYSPTGAPNGYWLGITGNQVYYTSTLTSWAPVGSITGPVLQSIAFDTAQERWFIGATSPQAQETLWTSVNGSNWNAIQSGGFSTGIASYGQGNALLVVNDTITLGGGTGAFSFITRTRPQILQIIDATQPPTPSGAYTTTKLSASNASNVFLRSVYGLAYESSAEYPYVAVGDGITPQKTIARSSNLTNWIPATTGGFSTSYGVLYYSPSAIWLATGSAVASTATIQYSQDAGSWFPTNLSGVGSFSGRAIAKMNDTHPDFPDRLLAAGEGENGSNLLYSENGFTWQTVTTAPSLDTIYGLGAGIIVTSGGESNEGMVAVGSRGNTGRTMSYSTDGLIWTAASGFQFEVAAYDVACGSDLNGDLLWIAVGQSSNPGGPTIAYSPNGRSWSSLDFSLGGFFYAGYSVVYNPHSNVFIATGRDELNTYSIRYSGDGVNWNILSGSPTTNGFLSQQIIGTANSIYGQQILTFEREPFITMPKFIAYERAAPLNYPQPSLRVLSTSMILNEALAINLSSQIILNSNLPFNSQTTVTVEGDVSTVNLIYKGSEPTYHNLLVSSMTFSTIEVKHVMEGNLFTTPSYDFFIGKQANVISTATAGSLGDATTILNDVLTVSQQGFNILYPYVHISTNTKPIINAQAGRLYSELDVGGITATSSVSLSVHKQPIVQFQEPNQTYISTAHLLIFEGSTQRRRLVGKNTIVSQASTISFNSALTINQSTQRVGVFTSNPLFDFDMRRAGWISNLTGGGIRTETVFFTIQSI